MIADMHRKNMRMPLNHTTKMIELAQNTMVIKRWATIRTKVMGAMTNRGRQINHGQRSTPRRLHGGSSNILTRQLLHITLRPHMKDK
jgi:hypothetical protein